MSESYFKIPRKPVPAPASTTSRSSRSLRNSEELQDSPYDPIEVERPSRTSINSRSLTELTSLPDDPLSSSKTTLKNSTQELNDEKDVEAVYWNSSFLKRRSLLALTVVLVLMFVALQVLATFSTKNNGLSTAVTTNHYLWTYGPTAVLFIISAWWRQIDYRTRQLMPWIELQKGPEPAEKTLLLDYISPLEISTTITAFKNRHWLVLATQASFNFTKIVIIASTALFVLQPVDIMVKSVPIRIQNQFNARGYNFLKIDFRPTYNTYWISKLGMDFPTGTTAEYAYQKFTPFSNNATNISAIVDTFSADFGCELATVGKVTAKGKKDPTYNLELIAPECGNMKITYPLEPDYSGNKPNADIYSTFFANETCSNRVEREGGGSSHAIIWQLWKFSGRENSTNLQKTTALICNPSYQVRKATVVLDSAMSLKPVSIKLLEGPSNEPRSIPQFSQPEFRYAIYSLLNVATGSVTSLSKYTNASEFQDHSINDFSYLSMLMEPNTTMSDMMDPHNLQRKSSKAFKMISAQLANGMLTAEGITDSTGDGISTQQRLVIKALSLRIMQSLLLLMALLAIVICFLLPRRTVCRDPGSVGAIALILSTNPQILRLFRDSGVSGLKEIKQLLSGYKFRTVATEKSFKIEATPDQLALKELELSAESRPKFTWWNPFAVTNLGKVIILLIPILLIISLELLFRESQNRLGLGDAPKDEYVRYTWAYIPAFTMVIVQLLFSLLDFAVKTMEPYRAMHVGPTPAERSVFDNPMNKPTLHAVWDSVKLKQLPVFLTSVAMIVAPFLTIAVSGLYTANIVSRHSTIEIKQVGWFNESSDQVAAKSFSVPEEHLDRSYINSAGLMLATMVTTIATNESYPPFTYENLAFPALQSIDKIKGAADLTNSTTTLTTILPAVRPRLNCSVIPRNNNLKLMTAKFPAIAQKRVPLLRRLLFSVKTAACDLSKGIYSPGQIEIPISGTFGSITQESLMGCKNVFHIMFGKVAENQTAGITALECSTYAEHVPAQVTFELPSFRVATARVINPLDEAIPASIALMLDKLPQVNISVNMLKYFVNLPWVQTKVGDEFKNTYDPFFQTLVKGKYPLPISSIADLGKLADVMQAIDRVFGTIAAQIIVRLPIASDKSSEAAKLGNEEHLIYKGNLTYAGDLDYKGIRVMQNNISTRFLQGFMAIMFICAGILYVQIDVRKLLTKDPTSIAAIVSLLADSEFLLDREGAIPRGAEWMNTAELKKRGIFEGYMFSLGWWWKSPEDAAMERWDARGFGIDVGQSMRV